MGDEPFLFHPAPEEEGVRLDRFLVLKFPDRTRSVLRKWIDSDRVFVNGEAPRKAGMVLERGMEIRVLAPPAGSDRPEPESIPLNLLYEDEHLVVVAKPAGMVVHPAQAYPSGTLVNALLGRGTRLSGIGERGRPGIVHRLDRDTSGTIVVAKTDAAHYALAEMFSRREVGKTYHALVWGSPEPPDGEIDLPIGRNRTNPTKMAVGGIKSRPAMTRYRTLENLPGFAWLEIDLLTGRTHQIRVHMQAIHHPVVGDPVYGGVQWRGIQNPEIRNALKRLDRQVLHASELRFDHPVTGKAMKFRAPFPQDMQELLQVIRP